MASNKQRKARQRRRRQHATQSAGMAYWRARVAHFTTDYRSPEDGARLAYLEFALPYAMTVEGLRLELAAEKVAHLVLWSTTYDDARKMFGEPAYEQAWRKLGAALDDQIQLDSEFGERDSPLRIGQRRMYELAGWCAFDARRTSDTRLVPSPHGDDPADG